jgi:hypothetical protein
VRQWHTLDMLLSQLLFCLIWLNPTAWALHRAMRTNLEFLADRHALRAMPSLLLPFVFPPLKYRILMLNTPAARLTPSPLLLGLNAACAGTPLLPKTAWPTLPRSRRGAVSSYNAVPIL